MILKDGLWSNAYARRYGHASKIQDPLNLRLNAYRVLLTRARDGFIIAVPNDELRQETVHHLEQCGVEWL